MIESIIEANGIAWFIGQILGIVAIILGFITYQIKSQSRLLFVQSTVAFIFSIHYLLLGAYSGMAMNIVAVIRNFAYNRRVKKGIDSKVIPVFFVVLQAVMCAITWEAWYSVFILLGLCGNTYCMSFKSSQNIRKSILVTCPLVFTYNVFAGSIGGSIFESVAFTSGLIGLIRKRKDLSETNNTEI
ncbi:MAG: YgjV family protein [Clostridia bacterium]|nr:YgjV family protein [Clostridia bacterium]